MWGTQGWSPQWALQPSMFQNVPHDQIDWAALAKQWIQLHHLDPADGASSVPVTVHAPPPPPPPPPPPLPSAAPEDFQNDIPPPPFAKQPLLEDPYNRIVPSDANRSSLPVTEADSSYQVCQSDGAYWTNQEWELSAAHDIDERLWNGPPVEPIAPGQISKETFDYGHLPDNPPLQMHTVDYNHVSDQFSFNQVYTPENQYDVYWSQVGAAVPATAAPTFLKKDRLGDSVQAEEDISHIDAAKRKQLPAWIREGLEKMEQERLKRLEKERAEQEKTEKLKVKKRSEESSTKGLNLLQSGEYDKSPPTMPLKSKFDSDSEVDEDDEVEEQNLPTEEVPSSPVEDLRTEEEKHQELMLKVRRMLTEILLEVTNAEILAIAKEVHQKARLKAPARQLAMSSALPSVATGLRGLASYGSHSEESESEDDGDADDSSDSDEELSRKLKEKRKSFAIKEKKIIAELDREEAEIRERKLAKAKAEAQLLGHAEEKTETHPVSAKSNAENEEEVVFSGTDEVSQHVPGATVCIPSSIDGDQSPPQALSPESSVFPAADSTVDDSPDGDSVESQTNVVQDSEEYLVEPGNSPSPNVSDSEENNSGKLNDDNIQELENLSEENEAVTTKDKVLKRSYSENSKKGSDRKVKGSSEKSKSKKKRSRSKGSDSSGNKNSRTSSLKRSKRRSRSNKNSHRKKRGGSSASSSSSSSSSSSNSTANSSSSYRSTSRSKERHKVHRDSRYHADVRRSDSYERHRKSRRNSSRSRKKSHSRSPSYSNHGHSRSTSRGSYHNSNKVKHRDSYTSDSRRVISKSERHYPSRSGSRSPDTYRKGKKYYKRSRSRSHSRTPKKYKKRSRSLSSESETSSKWFSSRRRHR